MSHITSKIVNAASEQTRDMSGMGGIIARVINYHPPKGGGSGEDAGSDAKAGRCFCDRHKGNRMKIEERHTVDIEIVTEKKTDIWNAVPCFMYAQGIIDHGFQKNDKVFIQFVNGDRSQPVAVAYYRPPGTLDQFWNSMKYTMAGFMMDYVFDSINVGSD